MSAAFFVFNYRRTCHNLFMKLASIFLIITAGSIAIFGQSQNAKDKIAVDIRALMDKQCSESIENISRIDRQILEVLDKENAESEQKLRDLRDDAAAFVEAKCSPASTETLPKPQQ